MSTHLMELPRKILVGRNLIEQMGSFVDGLDISGKIVIVTSQHVGGTIGERAQEALAEKGMRVSRSTIGDSNMRSVGMVEDLVRREGTTALIGLGGGKVVDVTKMAASNRGIPYVSVPTSASHDGIASPFASITDAYVPYSLKAKSPRGILADVDVVASAPRKLLASGCGDLVAKVTAVKDWELARDERGEYFGRYAANLALLSAQIVMEQADQIGNGQGTRDVIEALISAGVAAGIAGSSRPCSGSEHLFCHALEILAPNAGLHGEICGLGTIIMAALHGMDWERIADSLRRFGAPTTASELGLKPQLVAEALVMAPRIRPERYTILDKVGLDYDASIRLAKSTGIL